MTHPPADGPLRLRSERHRAPLLWILLPFMAGLSVAKISPVAAPVGWLFAAALPCAAGACLLAVARRERAAPAALVAAMFLAGAAAYEIERTRLADWETLPPREARLVLRITHVFVPNNQNAGAYAGVRSAAGVSANANTRTPAKPRAPRISGLARVVRAEHHLRDLAGQPLYFSVNAPLDAGGKPLPAPIRTAEIEVIGVLQTLPRNAAPDTFDGYLASSGMNFRLTRGRLLATTKPPATMAAFFERARLRFVEILSTGLDHRPAQAGVLRAMVLGQKQDIDEEQTALFLGSGTMHLFAISGLHIAVIAMGIQFVLLLTRLPGWAKFAAGAAALWMYVQITGATPSAMRAFVMVSLLQAAFLLRLPVNGVATLVFAALVTLLFRPMQLFSASFQMSYGIVAALLLYGLPLGETWVARWQLFRDLPRVTWAWWRRALAWAQRYLLGVLGIGVAASLVSAICSVIYFKLFTPGALLANLVLIPAASLVILAGFLSLLCGLAGLTSLSVLFNHAAALTLLCMKRGLEFFLAIPGVSMPARFEPAWSGYAALALLLGAMLFGYARKWEFRGSGGFWPPVLLVILAVAVCARFGAT